jgi:predicted dehydrogenase
MSGHLDEPAGFDPGGSAYIVYENGVRAFVNGSTGNSVLFRVQAIGSAGEIVIGNYELELWRSNKENARQELIRHPFPQVLPAVSPMVALIEDLLDAVEGGPPPMSNGETGTQALEMIIGLHASSQEAGGRVDFPLAYRDLTVPSL